jgi:hypothetical protein
LLTGSGRHAAKLLLGAEPVFFVVTVIVAALFPESVR